MHANIIQPHRHRRATRGERQRADAALAGMQNNSWGLRRPLQHKQTTGENANQNRQQGNLWNPSGKNRTLINTDPTLRQISTFYTVARWQKWPWSKDVRYRRSLQWTPLRPPRWPGSPGRCEAGWLARLHLHRSASSFSVYVKRWFLDLLQLNRLQPTVAHLIKTSLERQALLNEKLKESLSSMKMISF